VFLDIGEVDIGAILNFEWIAQYFREKVLWEHLMSRVQFYCEEKFLRASSEYL
jgi:hypothetical protein